jgi:hypothetical protein
MTIAGIGQAENAVLPAQGSSPAFAEEFSHSRYRAAYVVDRGRH